MSLVVVGGQSRSVGKTSAVCSLISALSEHRWTALKITQYGHGICSKDGKPCDCAVDDTAHPFAVSREHDPQGSSDTSRYLHAGAAQAWWVRAPVGQLDLAKPWLDEVIGADEMIIAESNSLLDLFSAAAYLSLWDAAVVDVKPSARRHAATADALLYTTEAPLPDGPPRFKVAPPTYVSSTVLRLVREKLANHA